MTKIILTGYMGSGKSKVGQILSTKLGISFIDLDNYIEKLEGKTITELFKTKGEIYFRKIEHNAFKELLSKNEPFVLSTGGGTLCYANNHLLIQNNAYVSIYLKASVKTIIERVKNEIQQRPILSMYQNSELEEFIQKHLFERNYYYNQCNYKIDTNEKSPNDVVSEIISLL